MREGGVNSMVPAVAESHENRIRLMRRLGAMFFAIGSGVLLVIAAVLTPAEAGVGTHQQLGLAPCGWTVFLGIPCPSCGMTTSFAHAAEGNFLQSFLTQPFGFLLALGTSMTFLLSIYVMITASAVGEFCSRLCSRRVFAIIILLVIAAWVYKIAAYRGVI